MGNITELINNIKNAVFGKDVRKSICDAIEQCYDDAIANGHTDMEVAKARQSYNDLNGRLEATENKIDINSSRISNLAHLEEGSTTGDAELIDIRTGIDGKVYENAGNAVRNQIKNLNENLNKLGRTEYIPIGCYEIIENTAYYLDRSPSTNYSSTAFKFEVKNEIRYIKVNSTAPAYSNHLTFLDDNDNVISYIANTSNKVASITNFLCTIPEGTKKIISCCSTNKPNTNFLSVQGLIYPDIFFKGWNQDIKEKQREENLFFMVGNTVRNIISSYVIGMQSRRLLKLYKTNYDIIIECDSETQLFYDNSWQSKALIKANKSFDGWMAFRKADNTIIPLNYDMNEHVILTLVPKIEHNSKNLRYLQDITNTIEFEQKNAFSVGNSFNNARISSKEIIQHNGTILIKRLNEDIEIAVDEYMKNDETYIVSHKYPDFVNNFYGNWIKNDIFMNLYNDRIYQISVRYKNEIISSNEIYSFIEIFEVDNKNYIPEYYKEYLDNKINSINENQNGFDKFSFAFITDMHIQRNTKHSIPLLKKIVNNCAIKTVLCGGDWQTAWNSNEKGKNAVIDDMNELKELFEDLPLIKTVGNHEWAYGNQNQYNLMTSEIYNYYFRDMEKNKKNEIIYGENGTYFYQDDLNNKIRYISLNVMDTPDDADISSYNKEWYFKIGDTQLNWLKTTALNLPTKEWLCIILSHVPLWQRDEIPWQDSSSIVVNAWTMKQTISNFVNKTDYAAEYKGNLLCCIAGHTHRDALIDWAGTHLIVTNADCFIKTTDSDDRERNSISEQCFDVFSVDRTTRTVRVSRIGAGSDRIFQY